MNIFTVLKEEIIEIIKKLYPQVTNFSGVTVEMSKDSSHGDFATNAAMVIKSILNDNPLTIAESIASLLADGKNIILAEVAGPGFINIKVKPEIFQQLVQEITNLGIHYGDSTLFSGKKINVEFVSANPTGPLHIGHARGAVIGDAISRILTKCGYQVEKEYYVNDAGGQVAVLTNSCFIRYKQSLGLSDTIEEGMYPGEYLIPIGNALKETYGDVLLTMEPEKRSEIIKKVAIDEILRLIKFDLNALDVKHDIFTSERYDIHESGYITKAIEQLQQQGYIYQGILEPPKGLVPDDWEPKEQTIFKSTEFGDDVDRPVKKSDGSFTYFAGDLGLELHKINRGFNEMVLLLGADHSGYVKRIEAIVKALSASKASIDVKLTQMVNLFKDGVPFKMSKREGTFILLKDVLDEVGKDILRFVMLTRKNDTILDFDFEKVKAQSKDNPVFYVQYAHARACSVLKKSTESVIDFTKTDLSRLNNNHEIELIKKLAQFPKVVESAAISHEPHRITFYLIELANEFHSHWSKGNEAEDLRFIVPEDIALSTARCLMVKAVQTTIKAGLSALGINALESM